MLKDFSKCQWDSKLQVELDVYIASLSDEKYRNFQLKLLPDVNNFIGVRVPHLQKIAKLIAKGDYTEYLNTAQFNSFESTMIYGLVIGYINDSANIVFPLINEFIPKISNWSICDSFCAKLKIFDKQDIKEKSFEFICNHLSSSFEFEIRFAVVALLFYFIDDCHINLLFNIFEGIHHEGYYVKMAVAWAISICFTKYRNATLGFLQTTTIDNFTYNKALQKICESLRVSNEDKKMVKLMKK